MTQSFYTAIGGMSAGQTKLTVVADNIANMNTIGFKASKVNFSDVYYRTSSTGQAPTGRMGGVNPRQTGIGVQTASISRDFSAGTTLTTGLNTDLCINGSSFFTVASPTIEILYTRDGNFTVDANGNLVTSCGYKVLGTEDNLNTTSSTTPVKIPTYITTTTTPSTLDQMKTVALNDLNGIASGGVTSGFFTITSYAQDGTATPHVIEVKDGMNVTQFLAAVNAKAGGVYKASIKDGALAIDVLDTTATASLKFNSGDTTDPDAAKSNVATQMGLTAIDGSTEKYASEVIHYHQTMGAGASTDPNAENYTSVAINENGIIEVKYGNNDTLSVMQHPEDPSKMIFKYTLNSGVVITGNDLTINDSIVKPANLQIQFASFVNPNGLVAHGNNTYASGANCGMALYGSINSDAFGSVRSGLLEGSNVDLATEFADMVVSQRAIEANSRVFDTTNQILQTLARLGQ